MLIPGIDQLEFHDRDFVWKGKVHAYGAITGIYFSASVIQNRVNGIPTGKSYEATLRLHLGTESIQIIPKSGWFGMNEAGMNALQKANGAFSTIGFNQRLASHEPQLANVGF